MKFIFSTLFRFQNNRIPKQLNSEIAPKIIIEDEMGSLNIREESFNFNILCYTFSELIINNLKITIL